MSVNSTPGEDSSSSAPLPFLFHFMDERRGIELKELALSADLREFIYRELGISPTSVPKILMLTRVHDPEANQVGVELLKRGIDYIRLNFEDFPSRACVTWTTDGRTSEARILIGHEEVTSAQIRTVWYRHMSLESFGLHFDFDDPIAAAFALREWRWAIRDLTHSLECFWVNPPDAVVAASDRLLQLRLASEVGLDIPRAIMTSDPSTVRAFYDACGGQVIAKAVGDHLLVVKGRLFNFFSRRLRSDDLRLLDYIRYVPSIFQEYIPKRIEVRVTVVGEQIFAVEIHSQVNENSCDDYHRGALKDIPKAVHYLPAEIERKCRLLVHRMGLLFGALDLILTPDGRYVFLEVNAGGDWRWVEIDTGLPITEAMVDLLIQGLNSPAAVQEGKETGTGDR